MDRKKRKATGGRATNSNQKYPTVEVGEMVTVEQGGTSVVDLDEGGEQLDYLEVASLLQEKLKDFVEGGKGGSPGLELRSVLHLAVSRKLVSVDSEKMSPVLWRSLPKELLVLVLARLPLPGITRLRSLSKEWNRDMATVNSDINRALHETSPIVVAGFSRSEEGDTFPSWTEFSVTVCTQLAKYSYHLVPGDPIIHEERWHDMGAVDGGLACFVSTWKPSKANPLCIVVVNLLTRVWRKLPPRQYVYLRPPQMMHIKVDSATNCYRVVVVDKNLKGRSTVEMYDSGTRQWTKATPSLGSIFGLSHSWYYEDEGKDFRDLDAIICMYDFAAGQLKQCCDLLGPLQGESVITDVYLQDLLLVLHRNTSNGDILPAASYCITKHRMQNNAKDWVQERSYPCSPFEDLLEEDCHSMSLEACEDFLIAFPGASASCGRPWLLDLSTGEWSSLPNHFEGCFKGHAYATFMMTRASWNVVP